jgi:hypothetical protein
MDKVWITFLLFSVSINSMSQTVIGPKGTKIAIDSSKWKINGNNVYNKNSGGIGIGTTNPTAQFHTTGDVRFQGIGSNTLNTKILTADANGNITTRLLSNLIDGSAVTSINGIASSAQTFESGASGTDFNISSLGSVHTFNLPTASATNRGALSSADWSTFNGKENVLSFSTGLTRTGNTIAVNSIQNITALSNLTTNGLIKTSGGTGALSIATASDFPILNQNTTGNAATVTTNANLTGPVTSVGNATSISANVVTNSMLAQLPTQTFKGRIATGTGNVEDLTAAQATAMLTPFTSSAQGVVPASGGGTTNFLRADGIFAPITSSRNPTVITLNNDITTQPTAGNNPSILTDITGLSFDVTANKTYRFSAIIPFTSSATTNPVIFTIDGPTASFISFTSRSPLNNNTEIINYCSAYNTPNSWSGNNNSVLNANMAIITGIVIPSANGTVKVKFAAKTAAITAKAGAWLEYW